MKEQGGARRFRSASGFSLVELLIVVALMGIIAVISVPQLVRQLPKWHMNGTARDISAKLMMARLRAIQENRQHRVSFTLGPPARYAVQRNTGNGWDTVGAGEGYGEISVVLSGDCASANAVVFEGDGTATRCIAVVSTLVGESLSRTVSVAATTGVITVD
jgi:type IV fimbrial biogenesis protein FimT